MYIYKYLQSSENMSLLIIKTCELGHVQTTCFNRRRSLRFKSGPLAALWPSWRRLDVVIASLSFTRKREEHILNFTPSHSRFVLIIRCLKNISSNISPNMLYWQLMIFNLIHRSSSTEKKAARKAQLALRETGPKTAVNCHVEYLDGLVCVFWGEDGV